MYSGWNNLQHRISNGCSWAFGKHAALVARSPLPFIILPLVLTIGLSYGLFQLRTEEDAETANIVRSAPSTVEAKALSEFLHATTVPHLFSLLIARKDGGNMLEPNASDHVSDLFDVTMDELIFVHEGKNRTFTKDICSKFGCIHGAKEFRSFMKIFQSKFLRDSESVRLSYPIARILENNVNLLWLMANVTVNAQADVESASVLRVFLIVRVDANSSNADVARQLLLAFGRAFASYYDNLESDTYNYYAQHFDSIDEAIKRVSQRALPYLALSLMALVIFTVLSFVICETTITAKPLEGIAGVLNPILALATAIGFSNLIGDYGWNEGATVVSFIVLAIGVDDMFVLIAAWQKTNRKAPSEERLCEVFSDAGLSIAVTSFTNIIAFASTLITSTTKSFETFGVYATIGLFLEFIYQFTFFAGVLVIGGRREAAQKHACCPCFVVSKKSQRTKPTNSSCKREWDIYRLLARILETRVCKLLRISVFALYLITSLIICTHMVISFSGEKMMMDDDPQHRFLLFNDKTTHYYQIAYVLVGSPPNFEIEREVSSFKLFVQSLESIPVYSIGETSTELWTREYMSWIADSQIEDESFYGSLPSWLKINAYKRWRDDIQFGENGTIRRFLFRIYVQHVSDYSDRVAIMQNWRKIAANYTQFNISIYNENNIYADTAISATDNMMQDAAVAMLSIFVLSILIVRNRISLFFVAYFLLTVEAGVIAALKVFIDGDLDPAVASAIAATVGFSVDFLLHISHACQNARNKERFTEEVLRQIAWPVIQGAIATSLGLIGLAFLANYLLRMFFICIFSGVMLGLLHGLCILPLVLTMDR